MTDNSTSTLLILPFKCPFCIGGLGPSLNGSAERCMHCAGVGLTDDPCGEAERAPRPPGVMRAPCADCAFRRGSPELENAGVQLPDDEPFFCHQGLPVSALGAYTPVATFRGLPLGAMVCAGWWALKTGEDLPAKPYREVPIGEDEVEKRWAPKKPRLAVEPRPTVAREAVRQMDADPTQPHTGLIIQPYREHGVEKWVFRCWGTDDGCNGLVSLDHTSRQWAEQARDRHIAEAHEQVDTADRQCILCAGVVQPGHTCDPAAQRRVYGGLVQRWTTAHQRAEQLAAALREVLGAFTTARRDDGVIAGHFLEGAIHPDDMARWRAALDQPKEK